jgi:hypothetical protein
VHDARTADESEFEGLRRQLFDLMKQIPDDWLSLAAVQAAAGRAYGELDLFEQAMAAFKKSLTMENSDVAFKTVEQLANLQCRYAVELARAPARNGKRAKKPAEQAEPQRLIAQAITLVESLIQVSALSGVEEGTREQRALLGSAYKRLALISTGKDRREALQLMAEHYRAAYECAEKAGQPDSYSLLNLIVSRQLLRKLFPSRTKEANDLAELLNRADSIVKAKSGAERDFWDVVAYADYCLARSLVEETLPSQASQIVQAYLDAGARAGSPRENRSMLEHFEFLLELWSTDQKSENGKARLTALLEIKNRIQAQQSRLSPE